MDTTMLWMVAILVFIVSFTCRVCFRLAEIRQENEEQQSAAVPTQVPTVSQRVPLRNQPVPILQTTQPTAHNPPPYVQAIASTDPANTSAAARSAPPPGGGDNSGSPSPALDDDPPPSYESIMGLPRPNMVDQIEESWRQPSRAGRFSYATRMV